MQKVKAKHHKLNKPEDGNFGKQWNYICDQHKVQECYEKGFFDPLAGNFMAGDTIRILEVRDGRVRSFAEGIIIEVMSDQKADRVEFHPLGSKVIVFPRKNSKDLPEEKKEIAPEFIQGEGTVKYNFGKKMYSILSDGKCIAECSNKERAHSVARGDVPIPVY
mgnify:CR=1 FL=1|jgi:hypothetical protein